MANFIQIPKCSPVKFYESKTVTGIGFDQDFAFNQIKSFERKVTYTRKWQRGSDTTPIQVQATLLPGPIQVMDCNAVVVKTIVFTLALPGDGYNVYEAVIDLDNLPDNVYYLYSYTSLFALSFKIISEPIFLKDYWSNTLMFEYSNAVNDFEVIFTTSIKYRFRCEAGIMDFQPDGEATDYTDQVHNIEILSGSPFRTFTLYIADEKGVAAWVLDVLNRIFYCNKVVISQDGTNGIQYVKPANAKWAISRQKGYPLFGASAEIQEAINSNSLQLNSLDSLTPGFIKAYNIETGFFGNGTEVIITEIQSLPE